MEASAEAGRNAQERFVEALEWNPQTCTHGKTVDQLEEQLVEAGGRAGATTGVDNCLKVEGASEDPAVKRKDVEVQTVIVEEDRATPCHGETPAGEGCPQGMGQQAWRSSTALVEWAL